ncbi:MAG TPA: class I SAM-dependent methyltransferase [Thermoanaerobaculia bacterium]|nr:class I SAM-dependent methyltransferase [Thermoanaerobaculia bacterium]
MSRNPPSTSRQGYTERLVREQEAWWKRLFDVQAPYRRHLRRLELGFTLDVGCGLGRNLLHLEGRGVGIDHNPHSVEVARSRGVEAFTPDAFDASAFNEPGRFDSLLLSHVAEHVGRSAAVQLLRRYGAVLKSGGRVVLITPQEYGYRPDPTHVEFLDFVALRGIAGGAGLRFVEEYSFPFPRFFGPLFRHNEFVSISEKPSEWSDTP